MVVKTIEQIEFVKKSSLLVGETLAEVAKILKPGLKTVELDRLAESYIRDHHALPAFKGYGGFPGTLCISINDEVVHGIPGNREIRDGDLVSVDCGTLLDGWYGDYAYSFAVGDTQEDVINLLKVTKESVYLGAENAKSSLRIGDIGFAIQNHVESFNYSVVRDLVGHGIGKNLHEKPEVFNYGKKGNGKKLIENLILCIEPMINMGKKEVYQEKDGWTIRTIDGKPSAHFEHMVVVKQDGGEIISTYAFIEEAIKQNINIR